MKNKIYFLVVSLVAFFLIGCDNETPIQPSDVSNIRYEAREGAIFLEWDLPADKNFEYLKITYNDPRTGRDVLVTTSIYGSSVLISNTLARFGEYVFTFQTVSSTGNLGTPQQIIARSGAVPPKVTLETRPILLTAGQFSTNAQEPDEGPIAGLADPAPGSFFHTAWSVSIPEIHYFQVTLNSPIYTTGDDWLFVYGFNTRNGGDGRGDPFIMQVEVRNSENEPWEILWVDNFTDRYAGMTAAQARFLRINSELRELPPTTMFRFTPLARRDVNPMTPGTWFNLGAFSMFFARETIYDPEND